MVMVRTRIFGGDGCRLKIDFDAVESFYSGWW